MYVKHKTSVTALNKSRLSELIDDPETVNEWLWRGLARSDNIEESYLSSNLVYYD